MLFFPTLSIFLSICIFILFFQNETDSLRNGNLPNAMTTTNIFFIVTRSPFILFVFCFVFFSFFFFLCSYIDGKYTRKRIFIVLISAESAIKTNLFSSLFFFVSNWLQERERVREWKTEWEKDRSVNEWAIRFD